MGSLAVVAVVGLLLAGGLRLWSRNGERGDDDRTDEPPCGIAAEGLHSLRWPVLSASKASSPASTSWMIVPDDPVLEGSPRSTVPASK